MRTSTAANFARAVEDAFVAAIKRTRMRAVMTAFVIFLVGACVVGVLWAGATDVLAGSMTGGELSQFILYAVLLATGTGALSETWGDVQRAAGATERLMEILATEPSVKAPANPVPLPSAGEGRRAVRAGRRSAIRRVPTIARSRPSASRSNPGEAVALVGPSGAGKSTVFQLLLRFYDPQEGRILFDGVNMADADPRALRSNIALVAQDPAIFSGTILDNIRYGRPDATPRKSSRPRRPPRPMNSSGVCRAAMSPSSASAA